MLDDKWAMVAKALVTQPVKDLAVNMTERVQTLKRGMVKQFHQTMHPAERRRQHGEEPSYALEKAQSLRLQQSQTLARVTEIARRMSAYAIETVHHVQQHAHEWNWRISRYSKPRSG